MNRSSFRACARAFLLVGIFAGALGAVSAQARDKAHHHAPAVAPDFYAYAGEHGPAEARPAVSHSGNCFVSNSPVEASRGIRHWTGDC